MNNKYKTLLLGATFYGISKLMKSPNDCILIERTSLIGSEFVDSFHRLDAKKTDVNSAFGRRFKEDLQSQGIMNCEGTIYPAPALYLFCGLLQEVPYNILFNTEITKIEKTETGYSIIIFNCDGFSTIYAKEIIDTTSAGVLHDRIKSIKASKSLNVVIDRQMPVNSDYSHYLMFNHLMRTIVFQFPVAIEDDYSTAMNKLQLFWRNSMQGLYEGKIILTANTFAYHMPYTKIEIAPHYHWIPSCGFHNLLHAIDEGQVQ